MKKSLHDLARKPKTLSSIQRKAEVGVTPRHPDKIDPALLPNKLNLVNSHEPDDFRIGLTVFCDSREREEKIERYWHTFPGDGIGESAAILEQMQLEDQAVIARNKFSVCTPHASGFIFNPCYVVAMQEGFVTLPLSVMQLIMYAYSEVLSQVDLELMQDARYENFVRESIEQNVFQYRLSGRGQNCGFTLSKDYSHFTVKDGLYEYTVCPKDKTIHVLFDAPTYGEHKDLGTGALDYAINDFFGAKDEQSQCHTV